MTQDTGPIVMVIYSYLDLQVLFRSKGFNEEYEIKSFVLLLTELINGFR